MINNTNTLQNFVITREGQVTDEFEPSGLQLAAQNARNALDRQKDRIKLEARMWTFDMAHRTNYRKIRRQLEREKKCRAFEASIGLVAK